MFVVVVVVVGFVVGSWFRDSISSLDFHQVARLVRLKSMKLYVERRRFWFINQKRHLDESG